MKNPFLIFLLLSLFQISALNAQDLVPQMVKAKPERIQEQLIGPVETVLVEFSKMKKVGGRWLPENLRTPWLSTTYDRLGYRIVEDQLYVDKSLDFKSVFTYSAPGKLQKGVEYDYKGKLIFQWAYTHHVSKHEIKETRVFPSGQVFSTIVYIYDKLGNLIEEKHHLKQTNNAFSWIYQYNPAGRKTEESYYLARPGEKAGMMKSLLNFRVVFSYDAQGNIVEETRYNTAGQTTSNKHFQYEYDKTGNWISQIAKEAIGKPGGSVLEPTEITYRTITYYSS